MHAVRALSPYFEGRAVQSLFLLECQRQRMPHPLDHAGLCEFIRARLTRPAIEKIEETLDHGTAIQRDPPEADGPEAEEGREARIRKLSILREKASLTKARRSLRWRRGRRNRESNRINFNDRWNPLVLLVSRVGEEGIDLQRRARYILHYDLEWNPAKMEQREGRVNREGYGHQGQPINVRFFLLKGTYEERIFHTVMQRDQWFQILMGAQRRRLGRVPGENELAEGDSADADLFAGVLERRRARSRAIDCWGEERSHARSKANPLTPRLFPKCANTVRPPGPGFPSQAPSVWIVILFRCSLSDIRKLFWLAAESLILVSWDADYLHPCIGPIVSKPFFEIPRDPGECSFEAFTRD